jgi:GNAT superfamily N-acetyltransferase
MASNSACVVRAAQSQDCNRMGDLASQLGYECTAPEIQRRLQEMEDSRQYAVYVAELPGSHVVGWIAAYVFRAVELEAFAEITGLIVDEAFRSNGIGKILLDATEKWARHVGCTAISVHSNVTRDRAHRFLRKQWIRTRQDAADVSQGPRQTLKLVKPNCNHRLSHALPKESG